MKSITLILISAITFFPLACMATQDEEEKLFHLSMGINYPDEVKEKFKNAKSGSGADCADLGYMWTSVAGEVDINDKITSKKGPMRQCLKYAVYWLEKAVSLGDGSAAAKLATLYSAEFLTGLDDEMDSLPKQLEYEKKAFELLQKNNPTRMSLWLLTEYYKTGKVTAVNEAKAKETYKKYLEFCVKENVPFQSFERIATAKDKINTKGIRNNSEVDEEEKLFYDCLGVYYNDYIKEKLDEANNGSGDVCEVFGRTWLDIANKVDWNNRILCKKSTRLQCYKYAINWFEKGVSLGDGNSAAQLAWFYSERFISDCSKEFISLPKQLKYEQKAFELLRENSPNSMSLHTLTLYYKKGIGTKLNEAKAKETYEKYLDCCKKEKEHVINYKNI